MLLLEVCLLLTAGPCEQLSCGQQHANLKALRVQLQTLTVINFALHCVLHRVQTIGMGTVDV